MNASLVFDQQHYERLNRARGEVVARLLTELKPALGLRTAIDVGCGTGYFSGLLRSLGFEVQAVDGRQQNLDEAQRRNPGIRFSRFDAEDPAIRSLGSFDLVFCFGLLYHLENPMLTIRHLKAMAGKLLLVEGVIQPGDEPTMAFIEESATDDQGLNHLAFYPTESCLLKMLYRAGFSQAYTFPVQPDHPEYSSRRGVPRIRTVLAASHSPISTTQLAFAPEPKSPVHPCDLVLMTRETTLQKIKRFAKRPLLEKIDVLMRRTIKRN